MEPTTRDQLRSAFEITEEQTVGWADGEWRMLLDRANAETPKPEDMLPALRFARYSGPSARESDGHCLILESDGRWWKSPGDGYTHSMAEAHAYTLEHAQGNVTARPNTRRIVHLSAKRD